jgi:hypothetical protein
LFEYVLESALFYFTSFPSSERYVNNLVGVSLIRIVDIALDVGRESAQKAVKHLTTIGSHTSDDDNMTSHSLWPVGRRIAEEATGVFSRMQVSKTAYATSRSLRSKPVYPKLCSPAIMFAYGILETLISKAHKEEMKEALDVFARLDDAVGPTKLTSFNNSSYKAPGKMETLLFHAIFLKNVPLLSGLLQLTNNLDVNICVPAFGNYHRVARWMFITRIKPYRDIRNPDCFGPFHYQYDPRKWTRITALHFAILSDQTEVCRTTFIPS